MKLSTLFYTVNSRGVGASWEEGGPVKKEACVDVKNWRG